MAKRRGRKILIFLTAVLILAAVVIGLLQYGQVRGFKNTLIDLVNEKSQGKLSLDLGTTSINYFDLSFRMDSVVLRSTDPDINDGVESVILPFLNVNIGTLFHYAFTRQMIIEEIVIGEPYARVLLKEKEEKNVQRVNIAHELASFAPGIRAFLEKFTIELFRIERAGAQLHPPDANTIDISLIDLLVENWNMRELESDAQIDLVIRNQSFDFSRSSFSFEAVEYNYQENYLQIRDYSFATRDSTGRDVLSLEGKLISIGDPDFTALLEREEYVFGHLQITEPEVTANIYPKKDSEQRSKSRHPLSDLLKQNLGTMMLDSGHLDRATLNLNMFKPQDTIALILPGISMKARNLQVREDSSTMMIEELSLLIDSSAIQMNEDLEVLFSSFEYDKNYNVMLKNIQLNSRTNDRQILKGDALRLYNFSVFTLLYENAVMADSVILENGFINIYEPPAETMAGISHQSNQKKSDPADLYLPKVRLRNMDIFYEMPGGHIRVENLTTLVENIEKSDKIHYDLRYVQSPQIKAETKLGAIEVDDIWFRTKDFTIGSLSLETSQGKILVKDFFAQPENFRIEQPDAHNWDKLEIGLLDVQGDFEDLLSKKDPAVERKPFDLFFRDVLIDSIRTDIALGDKLNLKMAGGNIVLGEWTSTDNQLLPNYISASLENISLNKTGLALQLDRIEVDSRDRSVLDDLVLITKEQDSLAVQQVVFQHIGQAENTIKLDRFTVHEPSFSMHTGGKAVLDSLVVTEVVYKLGTLPEVKQGEVFGADVQLITSKEERQKVPVKNDTTSLSPDFLEQLIIHPGQVEINDKLIRFGGIHVDLEQEDHIVIEASEIAFDTPKSGLRIGNIRSDKQTILLSDFEVIPKESYVSSIKNETDIVNARFDKIMLDNVPWDSIYSGTHVNLPSVHLDGFEIEIRRDKTLTDPEPVRKPFLLTEMIPLPDNVALELITTSNGNLTYFETGEKTGKTGHITLNDIEVSIWPEGNQDQSDQVMEGIMKVYDSGQAAIVYREMDSLSFSLNLRLTDMDLLLFNQMVDSLESVQIKSGFMREFDLSVTADSVSANGEAIVTYDDLHIEIFKRNEPEVRNLGSELLTLLADGIILRHSREDAIAAVEQERISYKGPVNYWVKSFIHGAMAAIRKGKEPK